MLRIGICDDEPDARDVLHIQLEKIMIEGSEEIVYEFSSGGGAVRWFKSHPGEIDLLFLDVEMEGMNGLEAAKQIRQFDEELMIVFVTGYSDYVFDGYLVNAMDYIMKPAETERLRALMNRVRRMLHEKRERNYTFKNTDGTFRFPLSDISYFYSEKRKVFCVSRGKEYAFYGKLDDVERELSDRFVRIHKRFLVNPERVVQMGADFVTVDEKQLPISRAMKESAAAGLAKSMLGGM